MNPRVAILTLGALGALALGTATAVGQEPSARVTRLVAEPASVVMEAGTSITLTIQALAADGSVVNVPIRAAAPRDALRWRRGTLQARRAGEFELVATPVMPGATPGDVPSLRIPVTITWPSVAEVDIHAQPGSLYVGTSLAHTATVLQSDGSLRPTPDILWSSSDESVASVTWDGTVTGQRAGSVTISAEVDGTRGGVEYRVAAFPGASLEIAGGLDRARTGDVLSFRARVATDAGSVVDDAPVTWAFTFVPDDTIKSPGAAGLMNEGKFVAEVPGRYTILALSGPLSARRLVDIRPRETIQRVDIIGQGAVRHVHTSDLWVFEGVDGRDYALTGTWAGDGVAYMWDVTDPGNIIKTDSIKVDARTVNDLKVSPDSRYAALSREGASNRRNGVVILDLADPAHPTIASVYDDGLTGGVHNMFATNDYLFALSGGDKYVILDMTDIRNPTYVSEYNHPDSRIHDVWVHDGIAYSSEWGTGVVMVDVGNGRWGGSIENPVLVNTFPYPVGATHAAFPYFQESTGKFYLFLGDEIGRGPGRAYEGFGSNSAFDPETGEGGVQSGMDGYLHIIDFTDPMNPVDVARYEVPEAGSHNLWVEDDVLYQAYYEGGMRVVDVSGELMGNLATQGREISVFKAWDPQGFMANQPNAWGPQPYKGHIFFADFNSGLWAIKLQPKVRPIS